MTDKILKSDFETIPQFEPTYIMNNIKIDPGIKKKAFLENLFTLFVYINT